MYEYFTASPVSLSRFFLSACRYCKLSPLLRRLVSSFYRCIFLLRWKSLDPEFLLHHTGTRIPWLQQFNYSSSTGAALYHSLAERPQFYKKIKVLVLDWQFITPQDRDPLVRRLNSCAVIQTDFRVTLICFDWAMLWGFERVLFSRSNSPSRHVILSQ